jgi:hypothetical protein
VRGEENASVISLPILKTPSQPAAVPAPRVSWGDKPVSFHRGIRQFGSHRAPLFPILANETHAESLELSDQQWIDLRAWVDLNAPIHDRSRIVCPTVQAPYRYSPQGEILMPPADARAERVELDQQTIHPVFPNRCAACYEQPEPLFRPHRVDRQHPADSLFLQAPLAQSAGGSQRYGQAIVANQQHPDYQNPLEHRRTTAAKAWLHPDRDLTPQVEANRTPHWAHQQKATKTPP